MISVHCNLCGADSWDVLFAATLTKNNSPDVEAFRCTNPGYGSHAQIVKCRDCGLVYANPRWSPQELISAYTAVTDETYVAEREGRELTFKKHLQALEKWSGPGNGRSLLDVGAYIGVFVQVASEAGWNAWGAEPSDWAAAEAQKQGLNVIQGTQNAAELQGMQFDAVTMWDVIEHVADPRGELTNAFHLLKPGGWLAVHTMDIDSLTARIMGPRWPWLMDMHLYYFSQNTLSALLEKAGFEVVWCGAQGRYLRMGYLATRIEGISPKLGQLTDKLVTGFNWRETAVPVNFGDLFTIFARRPNGE